MKKQHRLYIVSLGCPKNLVDTETMLGRLLPEGYRIASDPGRADAILINTCSFIEPARQETLDTIEECLRFKQQGGVRAVVVTGCMATSHRPLLEERFPEVDAFLDLNSEAAVAETLSRLLPRKGAGKRRVARTRSTPGARLLLTPPHTAYLRIADGCSRACSFCTIPQIRGSYRSRLMEEVIAEAEALAAAGVKELNLIAQDSTSYGLNLGNRGLLPELLGQLAALGGIRWIRILYAYPTEVSTELLEVMARQEKVVPYLDLPLQHASPAVLKAMRRPHRPEHLEGLIERVRAAVPDISLRTAFIVGFPGESEEDFQRLLDFCAAMQFDHVGLFIYSPEEDTDAARLPAPVPIEVQHERYARLSETVQSISERKVAARVGSTTEVIMDAPSDVFPDFQRGRHRGQAPDIDGVVYVPRAMSSPGQMLLCRLTASQGYDLFAEKVAVLQGEQARLGSA